MAPNNDQNPYFDFSKIIDLYGGYGIDPAISASEDEHTLHSFTFSVDLDELKKQVPELSEISNEDFDLAVQVLLQEGFTSNFSFPLLGYENYAVSYNLWRNENGNSDLPEIPETPEVKTIIEGNTIKVVVPNLSADVAEGVQAHFEKLSEDKQTSIAFDEVYGQINFQELAKDAYVSKDDASPTFYMGEEGIKEYLAKLSAKMGSTNTDQITATNNAGAISDLIEKELNLPPEYNVVVIPDNEYHKNYRIQIVATDNPDVPLKKDDFTLGDENRHYYTKLFDNMQKLLSGEKLSEEERNNYPAPLHRQMEAPPALPPVASSDEFELTEAIKNQIPPFSQLLSASDLGTNMGNIDGTKVEKTIREKLIGIIGEKGLTAEQFAEIIEASIASEIDKRGMHGKPVVDVYEGSVGEPNTYSISIGPEHGYEDIPPPTIQQLLGNNTSPVGQEVNPADNLTPDVITGVAGGKVGTRTPNHSGSRHP